jgi:hypothetical protein
VGGVTPLRSSMALRLHRSKEKPPPLDPMAAEGGVYLPQTSMRSPCSALS